MNGLLGVKKHQKYVQNVKAHTGIHREKNLRNDVLQDLSRWYFICIIRMLLLCLSVYFLKNPQMNFHCWKKQP